MANSAFRGFFPKSLAIHIDSVASDITSSCRAEVQHLRRELEQLWKQEEIYWWQRSRVNWVSVGDINTRFFHNPTKVRRQRNQIVKLRNNADEDPGTLNAANLVLIPKIECLEMVSQFMPISLCNFAFKVLSKILANRFKGELNDCVSPNQRAFVPGRLIHDNIIKVGEVFHFLKLMRTGAECYFAFKWI
ncbi:uncharacterized protein LOC129290080 [Prosopis cineraria]|uniref:uncharacterized protein LOC129290080 n=1 Tax=Prosopis cineraria TaxID=364024 RepID=UPI00240F1583|nr:uncharacterized protein LOC129290080 [Prosopis cineraria]